jgi:hypothetical protein
MQTKFYIQSLSSHLFWDVNRDELDAEKDKKLIIARVLEYGMLNDWKYITKYYSIEEIGDVAITLRELDPKSLAYISLLTNIPKEKFRCFTLTQSRPQHWNF